MPLIFGDKVVNKISGPVSMHILKPLNNQKEFLNLPLIILFGDAHLSTENMCDKESKDDTFEIYDVNFLKLFNDCVDATDKIDFYVEGGDLHAAVRPENPNKYPSLILKSLFSQCYINPRSSVNTSSGKQLAPYEHSKEGCKQIPKIRWQSGDIRFFFDPESKNKKFGATLERLLKKIISNFTDKELTKEGLTHVLSSLNKNPSSPEIADITSPEEKLDNIGYLFTQLTSITGPGCEDVTEELKKIILPSDGLINKEMDKMPELTRKKLQDYILEYFRYTYMNTCTNQLKHMSKIIDFQTNFINLVSGCLNGKDITANLAYFNTNKALIIKYYLFVIQKYGIITEIFTLCRILKYLTYEERPIINIIYYGDLHIQNIYYFLTRLSGLYDGVLSINRKEYTDVSKGKTGYNRCIEIPHEWNIVMADLIQEVRKKFKPEEVVDLPTLDEDPLDGSTSVRHSFRTNKVIQRRRSKSRSTVRKSTQKKSRRGTVKKSTQKKSRRGTVKKSTQKKSRRGIVRKSTQKKSRSRGGKKSR